jgi:hypothetical protein
MVVPRALWGEPPLTGAPCLSRVSVNFASASGCSLAEVFLSIRKFLCTTYARATPRCGLVLFTSPETFLKSSHAPAGLSRLAGIFVSGSNSPKGGIACWRLVVLFNWQETSARFPEPPASRGELRRWVFIFGNLESVLLLFSEAANQSPTIRLSARAHPSEARVSFWLGTFGYYVLGAGRQLGPNSTMVLTTSGERLA